MSMEADCALESTLQQLREGRVSERNVASRVQELRHAVAGRADGDAWRRRLAEAVRQGSAKRQSQDVREFRQQLRETDTSAVQRDGDMDTINKAIRTLHGAADRQNTSRELVASASEALQSVLKEYSHVNSTLTVTGRFIDRIADKEQRDTLLLRMSVYYFFGVSAYIVLSRMFGIF